MNQDQQKALQQLQKMQKDMMQMQQELAAKLFEGTAGGGAVKAICTGNFQFRSIKIKPEACDPNDVETLEETVLAAVRDAVNKAESALQQQANILSQVLPPGFSL
jgi:DNA-binding YbaB/EbfC family protein